MGVRGVRPIVSSANIFVRRKAALNGRSADLVGAKTKRGASAGAKMPRARANRGVSNGSGSAGTGAAGAADLNGRASEKTAEAGVGRSAGLSDRGTGGAGTAVSGENGLVL